jgi:hypothetical protein
MNMWYSVGNENKKIPQTGKNIQNKSLRQGKIVPL